MRGVGKAALVAASVLVGVALVELGLRAFVPAPAAGSAARFALDPDLVYRLQPDNVVTWSSAEFTETSRTNALGLRGADVGPKTPGTRRILAIGDSFTFGHGVQDDETYPAVLERLLRARGRAVEVVNAGVPGYSTDQAYTWALRDGLALRPDLLLVGVIARTCRTTSRRRSTTSTANGSCRAAPPRPACTGSVPSWGFSRARSGEAASSTS